MHHAHRVVVRRQGAHQERLDLPGETRLTISYRAGVRRRSLQVSSVPCWLTPFEFGVEMSPIWLSLKTRLTRRYGDSGCSRRSAAFRERSV